MKRRWPGWATAAVAFGPPIIVLAIVFWPQDPRWEEAFRDENPARRAEAARRLSRVGSEQLFIDALKDDNSDVRLLAAQELGGPGPKGAERAWALCRALKDDHAGVRREAAWSLSLVGPDAWLPVWQALTDESPRVRAGAALALADAYKHKESKPWPSQKGEAVVRKLGTLLSDEDPQVRRNTRRALIYIIGNLGNGWFFPLSLFPLTC
jgi:HEAT repeat protein